MEQEWNWNGVGIKKKVKVFNLLPPGPFNQRLISQGVERYLQSNRWDLNPGRLVHSPML